MKITKEEADKLHAALQRADAFFLARDQMNGHVHVQNTRLSPITELVREAFFLIDAIRVRPGGEP